MSASTSTGTAGHGAKVPWGDVVLSAIASVSWALIGMAGTAALGLHLLRADTAGSLGPMTAAVVALASGGSVTPSGDVSAFGLTGAEATTAIEITPLGVSLAGAVLLSFFFLRSLRAAGIVVSPAELLARAGAVVALYVAMLGGLAWAGRDVVTIDGGSLGPDGPSGGGDGGGADADGAGVPGLGDLGEWGDLGGLLPDRVGDLVDAQAAVGFTVDTAPTLLGGLGWSAGVLLIALLASRRTPLPRGWEAVHHVVRPAVSALVTVLLVAVAAGLAAAAYAAAGDDRPERIAGAALLGTPNGVWLGLPVGLFVPWEGRATGEAARFLPDPLDDLLSARSGEPATLARLAELDGRVWLLGVAAAVAMLLAGVLTAVRTPVGVAARMPPVGAGAGAGGGAGTGVGAVRGPGALGFAGRCALRLGVATALVLLLSVRLTEVSVRASLSVLGFDAFGAGVELRGHLGMALLLGAAWGAGAGAAGALLAWASGAAGRRAVVPGGGVRGGPGAWGPPGAGSPPGTWGPPGAWSPPGAWGPPAGGGGEARAGDARAVAGDSGRPPYAAASGPYGAGAGPYTPGSGPHEAGTPYRSAYPGPHPYLRVPDGERGAGDALPPGARPAEEAGRPEDPSESGRQQRGEDDVYGAPTVTRPIGPPYLSTHGCTPAIRKVVAPRGEGCGSRAR
ncbi:streptophobe family protein, partial [Streptomyces sp. NPDC006134]|uniref:streptophobe family protein n=1 Tax=Streptomyces sp. NPDC006134 TaxID=3154467 RepID=UPI0033CEAF00